MRTARDILIERATRDVHDTLVEVRRRFASHPNVAVRRLGAPVLALVALVNPHKRMARDVDALLRVAARYQAGESAEALADEQLAELLDLRSLRLVIRTEHAQWARVMVLTRRVFVARLPDLARLVAVEAPVDYADLVRRAFPVESVVQEIVARNGAETLALLDDVQRHPDLLRLPSAWIEHLMPFAHEVVAWKLAQIADELAAIYAAAGVGRTAPTSA